MPTEVHIVKPVVYPVVICECENWTIKKTESLRLDSFKLWYWRRLLRIPLDSKEIKLISPKGNQPQIFIGGTDAEAEAPVLWPPDAKSKLSEKKTKTQCWE